MRPFVLLALFACNGNDDPLICTDIGCPEFVTFDMVTLDTTNVDDAVLEVCIANACVNGRLPPNPAAVEQGFLGELEPFQINFTSVRRTTNTELQVRIDRVDDPARFRDGDVVTLSLRNRAGVEVAAGQWTATFSNAFPNGEECEPCRVAALAAR
jgi:hypothetical protein